MTFNDALNVIRSLSKEDRLRLADIILDEDAPPNDDQLTSTQRAELERRLAVHRADPTAGTSWEEVRAQTRARRGR